MVEQVVDISLIFKTLSDATRRQILEQITHAGKPLGVLEMAASYDMSFQAVSKHLKVLEESGLIVRVIEGRKHSFVINPTPMQQAQAWMATYLHHWNNQLNNLEAYLQTKGDKNGKTGA
jgi:DNA-binding transcriptional ArsR family regulator